MAVRITCIKKDEGYHQNPHEGITTFGWANEETRASGESSKSEMIFFLEVQKGVAYVREYGNKAYVGVVTTAYGMKYLRTYADGEWTDNLLSLPEC